MLVFILRSGSTSTLFVLTTRRSSLGDWAFPVAATRAWNTLPVSLRTASSFLTFRRELKTFLFNISFPDNWTSLDIVKWPCSFSIVTLSSRHYNQLRRPWSKSVLTWLSIWTVDTAFYWRYWIYRQRSTLSTTVFWQNVCLGRSRSVTAF